MKYLIINHWDTDGIVSSALLYNSIGCGNREPGTGNRTFPPDVIASETKQSHSTRHSTPATLPSIFVPKIGQYSLSDEEIAEINTQNYDQIFIIDYALQKDIVSQLKAGEITVIDHHFTKKAPNAEYFNPVIEDADPDDYPCCVMAMIDYLSNAERGTRNAEREKKNHEDTKAQRKGTGNRGKDYLLESCIAAVGDKEHKILKNPRFKERIDQCAKIPLPSPSCHCEGLSPKQSQDLEPSTANFELNFDAMLKIKELIDSSYITGNIDRIKETIRLIALEGVLAVLDEEALKEQRDAITDEKEKLLKTEPDQLTDLIWFYDLKTDFHLISAVTRALSRQHPDNIIVTRQGSTLYVRRDKVDLDLKPMIEHGQDNHWNIGGKNEVLGIVNCDDEMFEEVIKFIKKSAPEGFTPSGASRT